jgi:penicillin-insensitive murein endopeptidase
LTDGVELPRQGTGFVRFRPTSPNYWGTPKLVAAVTHAAESVFMERPGGAPVVVGDLSARHGGKIRGHRSHRTGRDVDLLWYLTTPGGAPVQNPGFIPLGPDGLTYVTGADRYYRLDTERQWLLIKRLLRSPHVGVQFMFVSREVEALIVDYALARETDLELVWHAETVMLQPGDSTPHADHLHLRVACAPDDFVNGCEGGGPHWEWLPQPEPLSTPIDRLLEQITAHDPLQLENMTSVEPGAPPEDA